MVEWIEIVRIDCSTGGAGVVYTNPIQNLYATSTAARKAVLRTIVSRQLILAIPGRHIGSGIIGSRFSPSKAFTGRVLYLEEPFAVR